MIPFKMNTLKQTLSSRRMPKFSSKKSTIIKIASLGIGFFLIAFFIRSTAIFQKNTPEESTQKATVNNALATVDINREFDFPVKDKNGKEITKFKYTITTAELRDEIVVQGQKATALKGRMFLIFTIKITNSYEQSIDINSRNYIRLSLNGNKTELLAPDIHNDPVSAQPIATKITRLGFPIKDTDKDMILLVGEIQSDKQEIPIQFSL